jgi:transposase-like protein
VVRNGHNQSGTPTFLCRGCGRRFVEAPKAGPVSAEKESLVRRLLGERMSLRAIARAAQVSRSWLQEFVNALYRDDSRWQVDPPPPSKKSRSW